MGDDNGASCLVCGTGLTPQDTRCPACSMHRPSDLGRPQLWRIGAGLVAVYIVTAILLALK